MARSDVFDLSSLVYMWFEPWMKNLTLRISNISPSFSPIVYDPIPDTFSEKKLQAQLKRMIDLRVNPVQGIASKWDYEKGDWK